MAYVGRNDHPAASHFVPDGLGRELLALGYVLHLLGHDPAAGVVHLGPHGISEALAYPF